MTFLNPLALAGLAAVAAPIAIHLLNKMRVQIVQWGAMRFLQESLRTNQRRLQLEDLLLLLLRCLLIALLALAFAQPILNPGGADTAAARGPEATVILLDQSASMGKSDGIQTRMEKAKTAAREFLDDLAPGSQVALFLVTDQVNQVIPRPTSNFALIRRAIDLAAPADRTSDLLPAIRTALDELKPFADVRQRIVVFSDNQSVAWSQSADIQSLLAETPGVEFVIRPMAESLEENLAVTLIRQESGVPAPGQVLTCLVEVTNFGTQPAENVRVTLAMNEQAPADQAVIDRIEPGQSRSHRLNVRLPDAGTQTLTARIPADRLPADDERSFAVRVVDQMRVAIVEGGSARREADRDAYFLAHALVPIAPTQRDQYHLSVEAVSPAWIAATDLAPIRVIILANVGALDPDSSAKLRDWVEAGGSLIIFPGPKVKPADYNGNPVLAPILPATLEPLAAPGDGAAAASWQANGFSHPVTALWNDADNGSLASVRSNSYFPLTPSAPAESSDAPRTIVSYSDGTPAVMERSIGQGHVVLFSSTATTEWTNLPIHPGFVALLERLVGYLTQEGSNDSLDLAPGEPFSSRVSEDLLGSDFLVQVPDQSTPPRAAGKVNRIDGRATVQFRGTDEAGPYHLLAADTDRSFAAFAVQMDPRESDLKTADLADLENADSGAIAAGEPTEIGTPTATAASPGKRRELWIPLIWLAAIVALAEMIAAHRFSLVK